MQRNVRKAARTDQIVVVGRGKERGLGIRRRDLDVEGLERSADFLDVEEVGRGEQPIASTAHALERETRRFRLLEKLRNPGARQPHRRGKVFARVESAIGKLAQKREAKRSKH